MTDTARVILWGSDIGAVTWLADRGIAVFQYTPEFVGSGIQVAPLMMPLTDAPYTFPSLSREGFRGLPGLLADSLPDKFGNTLINAWLSARSRDPGSFTPVERLCYTGTRGMGALEFKPLLKEVQARSRRVEIDALVALANRVLDARIALDGKFAGRPAGEGDQQVIEDILRVGTSAGGARAKAVLAWNSASGEFRSGQAPADENFAYWLMKFDGVHGNRDKELADPQGFGRIEFAYYLMAQAAGINMEECRLHEEGGRAHFMTRRFDRTSSGEKLHMQSFGALMHYDFNLAGAYSYEQAVQVIRRLDLPVQDLEQQLRRAFFNVLARNQDDHVKNIAFLMNRKGEWRLSPAFDLVYSYNPSGAWTSQHQMSLAGKRDNFEIQDLLGFAAVAGVKKARTKAILAELSAALTRWPSFAAIAGVPEPDARRIERTHRSELFV
ncbi:MAG: type II toxin-antitoxin system HipA family toxin [Congregibacter sp.]